MGDPLGRVARGRGAIATGQRGEVQAPQRGLGVCGGGLGVSVGAGAGPRRWGVPVAPPAVEGPQGRTGRSRRGRPTGAGFHGTRLPPVLRAAESGDLKKETAEGPPTKKHLREETPSRLGKCAGRLQGSQPSPETKALARAHKIPTPGCSRDTACAIIRAPPRARCRAQTACLVFQNVPSAAAPVFRLRREAGRQSCLACGPDSPARGPEELDRGMRDHV